MKFERPLLPDAGFLRLPQVLSLIPISRSSWWDGIKKGKYPKGIKLSAHTTVWSAEDIRKLIRQVEGGADK